MTKHRAVLRTRDFVANDGVVVDMIKDKFEANPLFPLVCLHCGREAYNKKYHEARTK